MKTINYLLTVFIFVHFNTNAQKEISISRHFAIDAISKAVNQYHQQKDVGYDKYMMITMKIMKINDTSGEFILRNIVTSSGYNYFKPSHYIRVNEELVLIKLDGACNSNMEKFGINIISEETKKEALGILAGTGLCITRQSPPYMMFIYKNDTLKGKFFDRFHLPPERYWF